MRDGIVESNSVGAGRVITQESYYARNTRYARLSSPGLDCSIMQNAFARSPLESKVSRACLRKTDCHRRAPSLNSMRCASTIINVANETPRVNANSVCVRVCVLAAN